MTTAALLVIALAGIAIGATGIGGILVVPALTTLTERSALDAVAASSFAFAFTGTAAWWSARRAPARDAAPAESIRWLNLSALAGSAGGAALAAWLPAAALLAVVAGLALASGAQALLKNAGQSSRRWPGATATCALGGIVGVGSALSGTGGPVLLLPLLIGLRVPLRPAIAAAQGVQLPVACAASAVHASAGRLDVALGAGIATVLLVGWWLGRAVAARMSTTALRRGVGLCLVATGLWIAAGL